MTCWEGDHGRVGVEHIRSEDDSTAVEPCARRGAFSFETQIVCPRRSSTCPTDCELELKCLAPSVASATGARLGEGLCAL